MAARKTLRQEIDELRGELAEIRASRDEDRPQTPPEPPNSEEPSPETVSDAYTAEDVERVLKELGEATEAEIAEHPLIAVGAAFLLGLMIGRLTKW